MIKISILVILTILNLSSGLRIHLRCFSDFSCQTEVLSSWQVEFVERITWNSNEFGGKLDEIVKLTIHEGAESMRQIPIGLGDVLIRLQTLNITGTSLNRIVPYDVAQFTQLVNFISDSNPLTELPINTFEANGRLTQLIVIGPKNFDATNSLHTVGRNFLLHAPGGLGPTLNYVIFNRHYCVREIEVAMNRTEVIDLSRKLDNWCTGVSIPPPPSTPTSAPTTAPTSTMGTTSTTSGQVSFWIHGGSKLLQLVILVVSACISYRVVIV